jgi:uncharacterized membrane protein YvbJ
MNPLDEGNHMDHMMDFNWIPNIELFIVLAFIFFVAIIIILLYFLNYNGHSAVELKTELSINKLNEQLRNNDKKLFCPECGNEKKTRNDQYCSYCGTKI